MDLASFKTENLVPVGISEYALSNQKTDNLITYSLGSCAGISMYDPVAGVGGLIHCMLPLSTSDLAKARQVPATYVDTGVVLLLQKLFELGAERKNLICKVVMPSKLDLFL